MYKCFFNIVNRFFLICCGFLIICFIFLVGGCGNQEKHTKKPDTVSKRINVAPRKAKVPEKANTPAINAAKKEDEKILEKDGAEKKEDDSTSQAAQAEEEEDLIDIYDPIGKIDPFEPLVKERRFVSLEKKRKKKSRAHITPLERIDLSQLTLSAIVLAPSGNRAIVTESDGKGYVITAGTYIGSNSGRVTEVLIDRVIVEEEVENILGRISIRKRELKLQKVAGE